MKTTPRVALAIFTERARYYARMTRQISREARELEALRAAYIYMTEHTDREAQDLKDAIEALEESILLDLNCNGYEVGHE
jgi:hypothetical protein